MDLVVFKDSPASIPEFVEFWSSRYRYSQSDEPYHKNLPRPSTPDAIRELFKWKNGGSLSARKKKSVNENFIERRSEAGLCNDMSPSGFLEKFAKGGAIWRIFWLHCWNQNCPIYDQHVHRAMIYIENQKVEELGEFSDDKKVKLYLSRYIPFAEKFASEDRRRTDQALWAFGKFIKAWYAPNRTSEDDESI